MLISWRGSSQSCIGWLEALRRRSGSQGGAALLGVVAAVSEDLRLRLGDATFVGVEAGKLEARAGVEGVGGDDGAQFGLGVGQPPQLAQGERLVIARLEQSRI